MRTLVTFGGGGILGLAIGFSSAFWRIPFDAKAIPWSEITANAIGAMVGGGIAVWLATSTFRNERRIALEDETRRKHDVARERANAQLYEANNIRSAIAAAGEASLQDFDLKRTNLEVAIGTARNVLDGFNILPARAREAVTRAIVRGEQTMGAMTTEKDAYIGVLQNDQRIPGLEQIADAAIGFLKQDARLCIDFLIADETH